MIGVNSMSQKDGKKTKYIQVISIAILAVSMLSVFLNAGLGVFFGPLMALIFIYLYFSECSEFVTAVIVVANDALGTMVLGKISFAYLLLVLALIKILQKKKHNVLMFVFILLSTVLLLELYAVEFLDMRSVIYSLCFIVALAAMEKHEEKQNMFFFGVAFTVVLIAIHTCITGGVEFIDVESYGVVRKGIIGVGVGDSNYSCFLLNIGIICLWSTKKIPMLIKGLLTLPILYAMTVTLSTSGLLALLIILILGIMSQKGKIKALGVLLIVVLVIVIIFNFYTQLPAEQRIVQVDAYIERMSDKLDAFGVGDMDEVTTGRTNLAGEFWSYIWSQPVLSLFFGGNSLILYNGGAVPHNTYIGFILQTGLIGAVLFFGFVILRCVKQTLALKQNPILKTPILLKVIALFFALNLSFCQGSLWAVWMYILVLL